MEIKEIVDEYILLCYDIPANATKVRSQFLKYAHQAGAMMFTASVYLMPYSPQAMSLAESLAVIGNAVVWRSKQEDKTKALEITIQYDESLHERVLLIHERLHHIRAYVEDGKLGMAEKMIVKTHTMLEQLKKISVNYHTEWLPKAIATLENGMAQVYNTDTVEV